MTHVPYGYKIINAKAVLDEEAAKKLQNLYAEYLKCGSIRAAAKTAGIEKAHSMVGIMLKNKTYLGTDFYPQIIDGETFAKAQELRTKVAGQRGRIQEPKRKMAASENLHFVVEKIEEKYWNPYEQARYAYEQIKEIRDEG